jgi:hypothetical protein
VGHNQRDNGTATAAIDAEIGQVGGDYGVGWVQFVEADEAEVGEIGLTVGVANCELGEAFEMVSGGKGRADQPFRYECQSVLGAAKVEGGFRKYGFTCEKGLRDLTCNFQSPQMMLVGAIRKSYQEPGIGNRFHLSE